MSTLCTALRIPISYKPSGEAREGGAVHILRRTLDVQAGWTPQPVWTECGRRITPCTVYQGAVQEFVGRLPLCKRCTHGIAAPEFEYERWRHGGWYVLNVRYPTGAVGCVSRNYPDRKWRIVCDPRPFDTAPTFKDREEAARAERVLVAGLDL